MKQKLRNDPWFRLFWMILLSGIVMFVVMIMGFHMLPDDPPKEKPKKDTTKIDVQQMQEINKQMEIDNKLLDSLIMQIDSLKQKK